MERHASRIHALRITHLSAPFSTEAHILYASNLLNLEEEENGDREGIEDKEQTDVAVDDGRPYSTHTPTFGSSPLIRSSPNPLITPHIGLEMPYGEERLCLFTNPFLNEPFAVFFVDSGVARTVCGEG